MNTYYSIVQDPKLPAHGNCRAGTLRPAKEPVGESKKTSRDASCSHCDADCSYEPDGSNVMAVFCCREHYVAGRADYMPDVPMPVEVSNGNGISWGDSKPKKAKTCPECGGPSTRGRGWAHTEDCKLSSRNKVREPRPNCEFCGGPPASRRGHIHTPECTRGKPQKSSEPRPNCPECGGPPGKTRGWKHVPGCSKGQPVAAQSEPCPECGGPKRGRGYTHKEGCSKFKG